MKCNGCQHILHYSCVGLTEGEFNKMLPMNKPKWKCPTCKSKKESPLSKQQHEHGATPTNTTKRQTDSLIPDVPSSMVNLDTKAFIEFFERRFCSLREEWKKDISEILKPVQSDIKLISERLENWESRLDILEAKVSGINDLYSENEALKKDLNKMQKSFDTLDQNSRQCNLEIQNIPETSGEDLVGLVCNIGSLIGVSVPVESIRSVHRTAPGAQRDRPRNIVLQLTTRRLRDNLLAAARTRRELTTEQLSLPPPVRRFYINEHLTLTNKILFSKARELMKTKDYKHVWVRNANVMMRKTDTSKIIKIRSEEDLAKVI